MDNLNLFSLRINARHNKIFITSDFYNSEIEVSRLAPRHWYYIYLIKDKYGLRSDVQAYRDKKENENRKLISCALTVETGWFNSSVQEGNWIKFEW